jgi:putative membrane-bound dehydrogenase-like protein
MLRLSRCISSAILIGFLSAAAPAAEFDLHGKHFKLADGFTIELAAAKPLTERPICVDFDEQGRLYVAESSGTNDNVKKQLAEKPHSILRLEDTDGDGVFDARTVFADGMMFPEGCEWHDGSLYVGAPPQIWKLTDTNDDGVADEREVWFDGTTLTGCANDLHGPYTGPDGLIYWCKGAFAEQTHARPDGPPFVTKASHIFRHDPRGGFVEPILTGGMDNPVEVAWTRDGEPILSCTFLQHPANGQRDGLIHAAYGGVWGKQHGVIDGHPRTGDLMPPLVHLGAAAPCGLLRVEGAETLNSQPSTLNSNTLLACSFNMHKVTRHVLEPDGATFKTRDDDLIVCDDVDFHPTDIIEDADGSFLLIDTGGWYKLCCPTSQLHKPDIAGAIYRLRRTDEKHLDDARGAKLSWNVSPKELAARLDDDRFEVRRKAVAELAKQQAAAVPSLVAILSEGKNENACRSAAWALTQINAPESRAAVRDAIAAGKIDTQRILVRSAGLWRDTAAADSIRSLLKSSDAPTARIAAEALGRIGDRAAVPELLALAGRAEDDRFLFHSATYALIEIADPAQTRSGLAADSAATVRAALLALDQMQGGGLTSDEVVAKLAQPKLRETAMFILERHADWDEAVIQALAQGFVSPKLSQAEQNDLVQLAVRFVNRPAVSAWLAEQVSKAGSVSARRSALRAMATANVNPLPAAWTAALTEALNGKDRETISLAATAATSAEKTEGDVEALRVALSRVATSEGYDDATRLRALRFAAENRPLPAASFDFLAKRLGPHVAVSERQLAIDVLSTAALSPEQYRTLADVMAQLGPMELDRLLPLFGNTSDAETGRRLVAALLDNDAAEGLLPEKLRLAFSKFDSSVRDAARPLLEQPQADAEERAAKLEQSLATVGAGDIRRGQAIFQSSKAACSSCHAMGYLGGRIGPDLTRIGQIRTERDLLEAILYPSVSFVRSYEPVVVLTKEGQVHSGVPREEGGDAIVLATAADKTVTIARDDVEEMRPGTVSIMPAGLDKQLTPQELADLVTFLKNAK